MKKALKVFTIKIRKYDFYKGKISLAVCNLKFFCDIVNVIANWYKVDSLELNKSWNVGNM